jgi:flagellin-like protein
MRNLKGISPLVAAVLLIAVTMTIAGVLAYWATNFFRTETTALQQNQSLIRECTAANMRVYSCSYDVNNTRMSLILENNGATTLRDIVVQIIHSDNSISTINLNGTLQRNLLQSYTLNDISSNYTNLVIRTHCPTAFVELTCK